MNIIANIEATRQLLADKQRELAELMKKLAELMKKAGEEFFATGLAAFWEKYPQVRTIHWNQYTPYFNDGEECVFSADGPMFTTKEFGELTGTCDEEGDGEDMLSSKWDGATETYIEPEGITDELRADFQAVGQMIEQLDLQDLFGDHQYVRVHRGGVELEDYNHD